MNRGYAVSGVLYTILVLFMALLLSFLYGMQNKKNILDKLKTEVVEAFYCSKADTIEDLTGATVVATTVEKSDDNVLITIPKEGHYDTNSKVSVPVSEIDSGNDDIRISDLVEDTLDSGWFSVTSNMTKTLTSTKLKEILYIKSAYSSNTSISWGNGNVFSISGNTITITNLRPAATTVDNYNLTVTVVGIAK